jgi:tight adherence protein C
MNPALLLGAAIVAAGGTAIAVGVTDNRVPAEADVEAYLRSLDDDPWATADEFEQLLTTPFLQRVLRPMGTSVVSVLSRVLPSNYRDSVRRQLAYAGLSGTWRPEEVITAQMLLAGLGLILGLVLSATGIAHDNIAVALTIGMPVMGALYPRAVLSRKAEERQNSMRDDLPDTIDLLAISVEAGLGFEGAVAVVCEQFRSPIAQEFARMLQEMNLGLTRREALQNLRRRTDVPELSNFVVAMTQADALGMPVGQVLRTQAAEMRTKRQQRAREKAGKLPVKIIFPLMFCIFPAIFVVVLGPAATNVSHMFG